MDITYRPYIREDSFNTDYSLSRPVPVSEYTPKYLVTKEAADTPEENSVESSIDLSIQETPIEEYQSLVKKPIKKFTSKEEFKSIMTPIYERLLRQKGLNPTFAKALVAQDGLESAWGKKPSGLFNFGGIKGKGTVASTREVINGKDIRLNQEFKDFSSLEDYANYKINLLNNKRYRAFSGSVNDFASRVARGGYATDPKYQSVLHKMIQNSKLGGIIPKFQNSGKFYTIKQGDTLLNIAKKNNLQLPQILKLNPSIQDPNKIQVGQQITLIPSTNQLYEQTNDLIRDNLSKRKGPMFFQTDLEKDHKLNFIPKDSQFKDLKEQVKNMVHHPQYQNIVNILSKAGLKDYVVHGIIGNMWQESKFDPNSKSSNGTYNGLVQLSPRLWNNYQLYLQKNNLTNTIENQLQYLIPIWTNQTNSNPHDIEGVDIFKDEWGGGGRQDEFWSEISKTNSASKAAMLFRHYFERPQSSDTYRRELLADWSYRYINGE